MIAKHACRYIISIHKRTTRIRKYVQKKSTKIFDFNLREQQLPTKKLPVRVTATHCGSIMRRQFNILIFFLLTAHFRRQPFSPWRMIRLPPRFADFSTSYRFSRWNARADGVRVANDFIKLSSAVLALRWKSDQRVGS